MLISREYELVNRFIILKCTCFEDIQRNYPKLQNAEDTIIAIQKFSWLTFRLNWCIEYTYWTKHFQYSYPWCQWPQSNADLLMHVVDAYALMPNFDVAWARRSFSFGKCQVYFSLPANVHPDSYLVSIHSWLNKVDPTRSPCVLHVTSRVVLRREGNCFFDSDWSYQGQISMIIQDFLCSSTPRFAVYLTLCANNNLCGAPPAIPADAHPEVPYWKWCSPSKHCH